MKITQLHVFDFDGTLVDSSHRYRTISETGKIDLKYWIANENKALEDSPLPYMSLFKTLLKTPGHFPLIATARIWCPLSAEFARRHNINATIIARKNRQDCRGGAALKITGVNRLLNLKQFQGIQNIHVYEDNQQYLNDICVALPNTIPHFIPSNQGH